MQRAVERLYFTAEPQGIFREAWVFDDPQLQAGMVEGVAGKWRIGQLAAQGKRSELCVGNRLPGLQVEKIGSAITEVVEIGQGQCEHPLWRGNAPVIPAFAPSRMAVQGAVDLWAAGPANGCIEQTALVVAQRLQGNGSM